MRNLRDRGGGGLAQSVIKKIIHHKKLDLNNKCYKMNKKIQSFTQYFHKTQTRMVRLSKAWRIWWKLVLNEQLAGQIGILIGFYSILFGFRLKIINLDSQLNTWSTKLPTSSLKIIMMSFWPTHLVKIGLLTNKLYLFSFY